MTIQGYRVPVEAAPEAREPDYADAFAVEPSAGDARTAEQWARDAFAGLSPVSLRGGLLAHRWLLGFDLEPGHPGHVFGWPIASSGPERFHIRAQGPLMTGHMVWELQPERLVMTTSLYFRNHAGRAVWAVLGNVHRHAAPDLLALGARDSGV